MKIKISIHKIFVFLLITSIIWGTTLQLFYISGVGSVYPLRIILVFYLLYEILKLIKYRKINRTDIKARTKIIFFLFWVWIFFVTLINEKSSSTVSSFVTYTMNLLMICCVADSVENNEDEKIVFVTITLNSIILGILGIVESLSGTWIFRADMATKWDTNAFGMITPVTIFHNTNNYCMFMIFSLIVFLFLFKSKILRLLYLCFIGAVVILTDCRTGIISIILIFLIIFSVRLLNSTKKKIAIYGIVSIVSLIYLLFNNIVLTNDRLLLWKNILTACKITHFLGVGTGNTVATLTKHLTFIVHSAKGGIVFAPHNYFLELLLETGIIGIFLLGYCFSPVIKRVWINRNDENKINYLIFIIMLVVTSICVSTMTDFFQYWMYLGIVLAEVGEKNMKKNKTLNSCIGIRRL